MPAPAGPAEGGRPAPAPALTWHTCSFLAVAPRSDLLEEMDASVWVSSALSSGDSGGSSPGPSETWEEGGGRQFTVAASSPAGSPLAWARCARAHTGSGPPAWCAGHGVRGRARHLSPCSLKTKQLL